VQKLQVWDLDVWGHASDECEDYGCPGDCEGFTVNDRSRCGTLELPDEPTEAQVASALYDQGFTTTPEVSVEWVDENWFDVSDPENGQPIFQITSA